MEAAEKLLTILPARWCHQAEQMLARSVLRAPCFSVADYRRMVDEDADCNLYQVKAGTELVGFVILRVVDQSGGAEGEILAAAGRLDGADLTRDVLPALLKMFKGVKGYRITTARAGLVKKLAALGWSPTHTTLRLGAA